MQQDAPQLRFATTRLSTGLQVHYAEQGDPGGETLVFLHGYASSWFSFSRILPLLPPRYRAVVPDSRGHGDSEHPDSGYTMGHFVADAVGFMETMGIARATLIGHSLGSFVARRVASTYPAGVARLVLIGSSVTPVNDAVLKLREAVQTLPDPVPPEILRAILAGTVQVPLPDPFMEGLVDSGLQVPGHVLRSALDGLLAMDDASDLGQISAPTLLLSGEQHLYFGRAEQERLAAAIPDARLTLYPETGTSPHWERPEQVAADLDAFIQAT